MQVLHGASDDIKRFFGTFRAVLELWARILASSSTLERVRPYIYADLFVSVRN